MLLSPRAWFRLPGWLAFRDTLTQKHATGWGALQIRIVGVVLIDDRVGALRHVPGRAVTMSAERLAIGDLVRCHRCRQWHPNAVTSDLLRLALRVHAIQ